MGITRTEQSERYYRAYQRWMSVGLVFVLSLIVYNVFKIFTPATGGIPLAPLVITGVFFALLLVVQLATLQGHLWNPKDPGARSVAADEWIRANRARATLVAFWIMFGVQVPMTPVMAYLPPRAEQGVVGMGVMTMLLGLGSVLAAYLYFSRQRRDE